MKKAATIIVAASGALDRLCRLFAKAALVGMVLVIWLQIVARYGLRSPPAWTEELARYLMVWGGLLGATLAFRRGADPSIVRADERAGNLAAIAAKVAVAVTVVIFIVPIIHYSFFGQNFDPTRSFMMRSAARTTPGLGINLAFVAAAIPTSCIILLIHLAARLVDGPIRTQDREQDVQP
ncbi:MAG: TRAP transporter small permease subunit [Pseudomonadota bacterium]|nr:TRAP transporter small permease subunit [Pseudomonadota bacterium]